MLEDIQWHFMHTSPRSSAGTEKSAFEVLGHGLVPAVWQPAHCSDVV
jgi:hypothetical protein